MSLKLQAGAVGFAVLLIFSLIGGVLAYEQVPEGNQGVTKSWGAVTGETVEAGAHFKMPIAESVQPVEIRPRTYTMSQTKGEGERSEADAISVKTVDGATVNVDITVRYSIKKDQVDKFVSEWNNEEQMEARLIRPTIRSQLRDEASDISTSNIYTREGREALSTTGKEALEEEFEGQPIKLEKVQVRNIDLPNEIENRLEEKEEAKQQVLVEQEKIEQEKKKKEQRIIQAQAEAEEIRIQGKALDNNPRVLELRRIEALKEGETIYVPTDSGSVTLTKETGSSSE